MKFKIIPAETIESGRSKRMTNLNKKHYSKSLRWQLKSLTPVFWIFVAIIAVAGINVWIFR